MTSTSDDSVTSRIESAKEFRDFFEARSICLSNVNALWNHAEKHYLDAQLGKTDQSHKHCLRVEENLYRLIQGCKHLYQEWNELDFFYLSIAACLHDLGKIPSNSKDSQKSDHGEVSCERVRKYFDQHLDPREIETVSQIIEYHSTRNKEILENINEKNSPNIRKLAVLFLLGDVLDTTTDRAHKSTEIINENYNEDIVYKSRKLITSWEIVDNGLYDKIKIVATVENQQEYDQLNDYIDHLNKDLFPAYPYLITYNLPTKLILYINPRTIQKCKIQTSNQVKPISIGDIEQLRNKYNSEREQNLEEYTITNLNPNAKMIIDKILTNQSPKKILVVGDVMLDHSMTCYPTPFDSSTIHNIDEDYSFCIPSVKPVEDKKLGGAANIAYCCSEFSEVVLFGVTGKDTGGDELLKVATESHNITPQLKKIDNFVTTVKIYYYIKENGKKDKTIRINFELDEEAGKEAISDSIDKLEYEFRSLLNDEDIECVIFKDHQKGFLSAKFLKEISYYINARLYNDKNRFFVIVDPKYDWEKFLVFDEIRAITPNIKEAIAGVYPLYIQEQDERETAMTKRMKNSKLEYEDWIYLSEKYKNICCFIVKADEKGASFLTPMNGKIISVDRYKKKERKEDPSEIGCGDIFASYYVQCLMIQNSLGDKLSNEKFPDNNLESIFLYLANAAAGLKLNIEKSKKLMPETVRVSLETYPGMC